MHADATVRRLTALFYSRFLSRQPSFISLIYKSKAKEKTLLSQRDDSKLSQKGSEHCSKAGANQNKLK